MTAVDHLLRHCAALGLTLSVDGAELAISAR